MVEFLTNNFVPVMFAGLLVFLLSEIGRASCRERV